MCRVAVLGHQEITQIFVDTLAKEDSVKIVLGVSLDPKIGSASDYVDMSSVYRALEIEHVHIEDYSLKSTNLDMQLDRLCVDTVLVVGWSRLIPAKLIEKYKFIGWHGGAFPPPRCRGRAGVNWALINRHRSFYYYTMHLDAGVDSGEIQALQHMPIEEFDTTRTIYLKLGFNLVELFLKTINGSTEELGLHSHTSEIEATLLPGRKPEDGLINWYQSDRDIDLFIRALSRPYPNAFSMLPSKKKLFIKTGRPIGEILKLKLRPGEIYQNTAWGGLIIGCARGNYFVENYSFEDKEKSLQGVILSDSVGLVNPTIGY